MSKFNEIIKYYKVLDTFGQENFKDLLNDITGGYNGLIQLDEYYKNDEKIRNIYLKIKEDILKSINSKKYNNFLQYKKVQQFSKYIKDNYNIYDTGTIGTIAFSRKVYIQKLFESGFIKNLEENNLIDIVLGKKNFNELVKGKNGKKELNLKFLKKEYDKVRKKKKYTEKDLELFIMLNTIFQFIVPTYGKDELNRQANLDESHTNICLFKINIKEIQELSLNLSLDSNKNEIKKLEFIEGKTLINGKKFIVKKSDKTQCFLDLVALYFSDNPKDTKVETFELRSYWLLNNERIEFKREKGKGKEDYLNLKNDNIKNGYIRTLEKSLRKQYINKKIFEMDKGELILEEMFLR